MDRDNHYEAAFEAYLRSRGVGFVAVDEAKRTLLNGDAVKSLDFVVVGPDTAKLVVDVKGRRFPGGSGRKVWENWSTADDVAGLTRWAAHFGPDFRGALAFVYHVLPTVALPDGTPDVFAFRERTYLVRGVLVDNYRGLMKPRSPKWGTVHLSVADFRGCVVPFSCLLDGERRTAAGGAERERVRERLAEACATPAAIPD